MVHVSIMSVSVLLLVFPLILICFHIFSKLLVLLSFPSLSLGDVSKWPSRIDAWLNKNSKTQTHFEHTLWNWKISIASVFWLTIFVSDKVTQVWYQISRSKFPSQKSQHNVIFVCQKILWWQIRLLCLHHTRLLDICRGIQKKQLRFSFSLSAMCLLYKERICSQKQRLF